MWAMGKKMMVLWMCAMLVIGENGKADAVVIGTPAMRANSPGCKGVHCLPPPSNPINRGCEKIMRCRRPPASTANALIHAVNRYEGPSPQGEGQ
ncbi:Rapid ALkalinization Factor [Corchorus capsularis]|uniref:Rapid ALkalinization Factor n=1 Tax=Corchorus capsularis TaxID=210143 RepID=A0A1R3G8V0_COCAP|nr:Rapid ALkalinization Factor [Corchorus capsularis]